MLHELVIFMYVLILIFLSLYGFHRYRILYLYWKYYKKKPPLKMPAPPQEWPKVTIQLPMYNEYYVIERLIDSVCEMDYPKDKLEIQVLDDSTDESHALAEKKSLEKKKEKFNISYIHRENRDGFKAGALENGLLQATGDFIAVFDADFVPPKGFLKKTIPYFSNPKMGMVQTRWGHINTRFSLLTRIQSLYLDGHFMLEHTARNRSGAFFNFNGTAGIWRRTTIKDAGGWEHDTLTEDLDLSYRAQMKGWQFLFLPDLVSPAELPVDIKAFRSQQHRWTKGSFQVAKKILPTLWKSNFPFFIKMEASIHLTSNIGYCLMMIFSLLLLPSLLAREEVSYPHFVNYLEILAFIMTTLSIALFYIIVQREVSDGKCRLCFQDIPTLMAVGVGMCINNSRAVWEAIFGVQTDFNRTAKLNIFQKGEKWRHKKYRSQKGGLGFTETSIAVYFSLTFLWGILSGNWLSLPFIALFLTGYWYVGILTLTRTLEKA